MTRLEYWFFKRILDNEVLQGFNHANNIKALYAMIRKACEDEFTEDNAPTLDVFLRELFEETQVTKAT